MNNPPLGIVLQKESYLAMIHNAVGTNLFRHMYARNKEKSVDILEDGKKSCASFVSMVLHSFYLIETPHTGIAGLEKDLVRSGWHTTDTPSPGDVLIWEPRLQDGDTNAHTGFFIGDDQAISNDWQTRVPAKHHMTYGVKPDGTPVRAVTTMYTYDFKS